MRSICHDPAAHADYRNRNQTSDRTSCGIRSSSRKLLDLLPGLSFEKRFPFHEFTIGGNKVKMKPMSADFETDMARGTLTGRFEFDGVEKPALVG